MTRFTDLSLTDQTVLARTHLNARQFAVWQAYYIEYQSVYAYADSIGRSLSTVYRWLLQAKSILDAEMRDLDAVCQDGYPITFHVVSGGGTTRMDPDETLRRACPSLLPPKKERPARSG